MSTSVPTPTTFAECCAAVDPCQAACEIENAIRDRWNKKTMRRFELGEETMEIALPSVADLRALLTLYQARCRAAQGKKSRGYGRFSTPTCRTRFSGRGCR